MFINFKQNNWAKLLQIVTFMYNYKKYIDNSYMFFKLDNDYYYCVFFRDNIDSYSHSKIVDKLVANLEELFAVYCKNFDHA